MGPLPNAPKVIRVALVHKYGANLDVVTRFFIRYAGTAPTVAQLDTFCGAVGGAWAAGLAGECSPTITLEQVTATDLSTPSSAQGAAPSGAPGTRAGGVLPADASFVAAYVIARRYRGGHARGYWPFGTDSDVGSPQFWDSGSVTEFQTNLNGFFAAVFASGWAAAGTLDHVNVSYFAGNLIVTHGTPPRARNVPVLRGAPIIDAVVGILGRLRIGSQRRRLG